MLACFWFASLAYFDWLCLVEFLVFNLHTLAWLLLGLLTGLLVLLGFLDLRGLRALLTLLDLLGLLASLCLPPSRFASALRFYVTCLLALLAPSAICLRASPFTLPACFALFAVLFAY